MDLGFKQREILSGISDGGHRERSDQPADLGCNKIPIQNYAFRSSIQLFQFQCAISVFGTNTCQPMPHSRMLKSTAFDDYAEPPQRPY